MFPAVLVLENFPYSLDKYTHIQVWLAFFYELILLIGLIYL